MIESNRVLRSQSRRRFLQMSAGALAAPAIISRGALASSGELNVSFWSDELPESHLKGFTDATGIKVNFYGYGSNDELLNKLRATNGRGFDIVSPTHSRGTYWRDLSLTQAWDLNRVPVDRLMPALFRLSDAWKFDSKGTHWLPHVWGSTGMAWRTDLWTPADVLPSYGDIWADPVAGKIMGDKVGLFSGTALWMESTGVLPPGSFYGEDVQSEEKMRKVWDQIARYCIEKKSHIRMIWNNADMIQQGFLNEGIVLGVTWDGPVIVLKNAGNPMMYRSPREGATGWSDGISLLTTAVNVEQAYAFLEYNYSVTAAGKAIALHGYHSPVIGATELAGDQYKKNFEESFPGDSLSKLRFTPVYPKWFIDARAQYYDQFLAA